MSPTASHAHASNFAPISALASRSANENPGTLLRAVPEGFTTHSGPGVACGRGGFDVPLKFVPSIFEVGERPSDDLEPSNISGQALLWELRFRGSFLRNEHRRELGATLSHEEEEALATVFDGGVGVLRANGKRKGSH